MESNSKSTLKNFTKEAKPRRLNETIEINEKMSVGTVNMLPSEYIKQISLNPEKVMCEKWSDERKASIPFTTLPKVMIFKNFSRGNEYNASLEIKNTSEIPHRLRLLDSDSAFFHVKFAGLTLYTRLAPGNSQIYNVKFIPDDNKDYSHDITFKSELGSFTVPVIALGPRALLSFPDHIDMAQTVIKVPRIKPILMQNIGNTSTAFSLFTDNQCFTISPTKSTVAVDEIVQLTVNFTPLNMGICNGHVFLRYESGDIVQSTIYGETVKCEVGIKEENITFENTYLGLSRFNTIEIQNDSDYLLHFEFMLYKSVDEDTEEKERYIETMRASDNILRDTSIFKDTIDKRIYDDSIESIKKITFSYVNDHFTIFPMSAEVYPRRTMEISVNFQPTAVADICSNVYLEIDGLENRIPVNLSGKCLGPFLQLNLLSLDVQEVYLSSTYFYQVVCKNASPIPGTLMHVRKSPDFGSTIEIEPSEVKVGINELKSMKLSYRSNRTGNFVERIDFLIKESLEVLSFVMKGKVICPLIKTDDEEISFGSASLGFTKKKCLNLRNLSHESIEISVKVPSDGYENTLTHEDFAKAPTKAKLPSCPREFYICPCDCTVEASGSQVIQIFHTPNIARIESVECQIDFCNSSNAEPLILPISLDCSSATFSITPEEINVRFCFLNFPYSRKIIVANDSDIEGYFYINPQEVQDDITVLYSLSTYHGTLKSNQTKEITLTFIVKAVGKQKFNLNVYSFGMENPITSTEVICIGQGPVISIIPSHLHWGEITLLQKVTLNLTIINDSPITAEFTTSLIKTKDIWKIEPSNGELEPNESISLRVSIFLRDTGIFTDRLIISILNGNPINVHLSATGVGTSIVFEPQIFPTFHLGIHFCRQYVCIPIKVKNEGTKFHHILLTNEEKIRQGKKAPNTETENVKFQIEPNVIELHPGQMQMIDCKIRQNTKQIVSETWYINATLEGQGKRELLGTSTLTATFVEPNIRFDKDELTFRLDFGHDIQILQQEDEILVTNQCERSITAHVTIDNPFVLINQCDCHTDSIDMIVNDDESIFIRVSFPFAVEQSDTIPQKYEAYLRISYDEHRAVDKIMCRAEVNFPHVIFIPNNIQMYCVHGWSSEETMKMINDSPLPVSYTIKWLKNTFEAQHLNLPSEDGSEGLMSDRNMDISICTSKDDNSSEICSNGGKTYQNQGEEGWSESSSEIKIPCIDLIDQFIQIVPANGLIPPLSECYVNITFNGIERVKISIQAICEIERGSSQLITVNATADTVKCEILDKSLEFSPRLYRELNWSTLRISNQCMIPLSWTIESSTSLLKITDGPEMLKPNAMSIVTIECQVSGPRSFKEKLFLEITHLEPFIIEVQGLATIPQAYLEILPTDEYEFVYREKYNYLDIASLRPEWFVNYDRYAIKAYCSASDILYEDREFSEYEMIQLIDNDWEVITKDERYPSQIDIEMISQQLIVRNWMKVNNGKLPPTGPNKLSTSSPYEINMKYVVIEQVKQITIPLLVYGLEKADVTLIRNEIKRKSPASCFVIQLVKTIEICQCNANYLRITFSPKKEMFHDNRTDVINKFYLHVRHGLKIPVNVRVTAIYPDLLVSCEKLNFQKVFIGECQEMSFIVKNKEPVDCECEIIIEDDARRKVKPVETSFYINCTNDTFIPGQEVVIKVYYIPRKNGKEVADLLIKIRNGQEVKMIRLIGYGVERKVNIDSPKIRFPPVIPNINSIEDNFIVENNNDYPIRLYWKHQVDFEEFNKVVRVFRHYYNKDEIFIPKGKINQQLPDELIDFYKELVQQMHLDEDFKSFLEKHDDNSQKSDSSNALNTCDHLHAYIDKIQKNTNYLEITGDPLQALNNNENNIPNLNKAEEPKKKLIIIYNGAPGTEYQETACRTAKVLGLPLLNLNQIILKALATNGTVSTAKLSDQINQRYKDIITKFEKLTAVVSTRSLTDDESSKILRLIRKIPPAEELERMDKFTFYETKLEIIRSLVESADLIDPTYLKDKSSVKSLDTLGRRQSVLTGIGQDVISEIFKERLSRKEFDLGYVLQTLDNDFVRNENLTVKTLLEATGEVEFYLLVAVLETHELRIDECENKDDDKVVKSTRVYSKNNLNKLLDTIVEWERGKSAMNKELNKRTKLGKDKRESTKSGSLLKSTDKFFIWYVQSNNLEDKMMSDSVISYVSEHFGVLVKDNYIQKENIAKPIPTLRTYSILKERYTLSNLSLNEIFFLSEYKLSEEQRSIEKPVLTDNDLQNQKLLLFNKNTGLKAWSSTPELSLHKTITDADSFQSEFQAQGIFMLRAHEKRQFKVKFVPKEEGHYEENFLLSLLDNPDVSFKISIEGIAEVPKIMCLRDSGTLDFGNLLVLSEQECLHRKNVQFKFKNISMVYVNVTFSLESENYDCFNVQPRKVKLEPLEKGSVDITACTRKFGYLSDTLILNVEHNDQPTRIQLECNGIDLDIQIEPKQVNLGRILLYRTEKQVLTINNRTELELFWKITTDDVERIQFIPSQGKIKSRDVNRVELHYSAEKVSAIVMKLVNFQVFQDDSSLEPIKTDIVSIKAQVYEILYQMKVENPIDFGSVSVRSVAVKSFVIKNLGSYEIKYEIRYKHSDLLRKKFSSNKFAILEGDIKTNPTTGLIPPKKQAAIDLIFTPSIEICVNYVSLFKCIIIEPYKDYNVVNEHLLNISATSYYTRFAIEPYPKLDFGPVKLKAIKTMQLKIKNTGQFPLKYSIVNEPMNDLDSDKSKRLLIPKKVSKRSSTLHNVSTKYGPFQFERIKGELNPKRVDLINVHCTSDEIGYFHEKFSISILDSLQLSEDNQQELNLFADVSIARLYFDDYSKMFPSTLIIDSLNTFSNDCKIVPLVVFSKSNNSLYFQGVYAGQKQHVDIVLRNIGLVDADVLLDIPEYATTNSVFQINDNNCRFTVESMKKHHFILSFAPKTIGYFKATLVIKLDLPLNVENQMATIDLRGESCMMQIQLIEPVTDSSDGAIIDYGLTFVSEAKEKVCRVKNIGQVVDKICFRIPDNLHGIFTISSEKSSNSEYYDSNGESIEILPEEIVSVKIVFLPKKIDKYEGELQISTEHNQFECIRVGLTGEGFTKFVVLENLELTDELPFDQKETKKKNSRDSLNKSRKSSSNTNTSLIKAEARYTSGLTYKLDFANCSLNQINKISFRIVNKTRDKFFRFQLDSLSNLVCTPSAGHLGSNSFKELTATFLSSEPTTWSQVLLTCSIQEIKFLEPMLQPLWDNRQTIVSWVEKYLSSSELEIYEDNDKDIFMKKTMRNLKEPDHQIIEGTRQSIKLLVSANTNYSEYQCDVDTIDFVDTLMFQSSERKFTLTNIGTVDLKFSWNLTMDERYPMRLDQTNLSLSSFESHKGLSVRKGLALEKSRTTTSMKELKFNCSDQSDLFSSAAGLSDRSTDSWIEGQNWPFRIEPDDGNIPPGKSIECTLKFIPVDVFEYKAHLQCKMENLHTDATPLNISISAKSLLPYCHFEIDESDYLSSGRRNTKLPVPAGYDFTNPNVIKHVKVAEFKVLGIGESRVRNICFVNPTTENYSYRWSNLSFGLSEKLPIYQCQSETKIAEKGKTSKISFYFIPEEIGLFESFWQFEIKKYNLKTLFIIVINVAEPSVCCKNSIVKLENSTIGEEKTSSFEILNNENCSLSFEIIKDSLYSEGRFQSISLRPMSGELNPHSSQSFDVRYKPSLIGRYIFNVKCQIEKLPRFIEIFVSAEVLKIMCQVKYTDLDNQELNIDENAENIIKIEQLSLNLPIRIDFKISNIGQIPFDFTCNSKSINESSYKIWFSKSEGQVEKYCHDICHLEMIATEKVFIRNYPLMIKIKNGPTYRIKLYASATKVPLEFSFNEYDFGLCYIKPNNGIPYSTALGITNNQKIQCLIKCDVQDNRKIKLDSNRLHQTIPPQSTINIPIYFQPSEEAIYEEILNFQVPHLSAEKNITIKGEGIAYEIHLKNPDDALINFGQIKVGSKASRKLCIVNEARATVTLRVVEMDSVDEESPTSTSDLSEFKLVELIRFLPDDWFDLKPNKEKTITLIFDALRRMRSYEIKLGLHVDSAIIPLTVVKAKCIAASYHLNRTYISFGTIFECCTAEETLTLTNDGDIDTRFCWDMKNTLADFEIHPQSGYCAAGLDINFTCSFKPKRVESCLRSEMILELRDYQKLTLNVIGNCCSLPKAKDTISFVAEIDKVKEEEIKIYNDSDIVWSLTPKILGNNFNADPTLFIDPKSSNVCTVLYNPKKETSEGTYDKGKLVIILPNGRSAIVYDLKGHCNRVYTSKKLVRELPAKKKIVESLTFFNNSSTSQMFDCSIDELIGDKVQNVSSFKDVCTFEQLDCKIPFLFENEGHYFYKITFDDHTSNYQCYEIEFIITSPEAQEIIEMTTYVRCPVYISVKIENPSDYQTVTFTANDIDDIVVRELPVTLTPLEFKKIHIEYLPLLPCDKEKILTIKSENLDEMSYTLHLVAKPARPEKPTYVKSSLGKNINFSLKLMNYKKDSSCDFNVTVNHPAFTCEQTINAPANEEILINVQFEPCGIETVNTIITASSSIAGEYFFPIIGQCLKPQLEGPFTVSPDVPAVIVFKNIFLERKTFQLSVDNSLFKIENTKVSLNSKENIEISVRVADESSSKSLGKIIITCSETLLSDIKWIYYVKSE